MAGIRETLYETVYDSLKNAHLLGSTATVTAAYIDSPSASFPQVVINPINVVKDGFVFDRSKNLTDVQLMIDIWTKKNKDKDLLADEIDEVLSSTVFSGLTMVGWTESNAFPTPGNNKVHLKSVIIDFIKG